MVKVLEHMDNVRWRYVCRGCASLLEFGADDVKHTTIGRRVYSENELMTIPPEIEYYDGEGLTCPVCGHANALPPSWKFKCERVSPSEEPADGFRWRDTTEELPTKSGEYFVKNVRNNWTSIMPYSAKHKLFNVFDHWEMDSASAISLKVTHWAEVPKVPENAKE